VGPAAGGLTAAALGFVGPAQPAPASLPGADDAGLSETLRIIAEDWGDLTRGRAVSSATRPSWRALSNTTILYLALALLVGSVAVIDVLTHSRVGPQLRAVREDETLAQAHG
jgi:ABC-type branched-subunit amino acid transport system permease subunit